MSTPRHTPSPAHPSSWSGPKPPNTPSDPVSKFPARPSGSPYFGRGLVGGPGGGASVPTLLSQEHTDNTRMPEIVVPEVPPGTLLAIFSSSHPKWANNSSRPEPVGWQLEVFGGSSSTGRPGAYLHTRVADGTEAGVLDWNSTSSDRPTWAALYALPSDWVLLATDSRTQDTAGDNLNNIGLGTAKAGDWVTATTVTMVYEEGKSWWELDAKIDEIEAYNADSHTWFGGRIFEDEGSAVLQMRTDYEGIRFMGMGVRFGPAPE